MVESLSLKGRDCPAHIIRQQQAEHKQKPQGDLPCGSAALRAGRGVMCLLPAALRPAALRPAALRPARWPLSFMSCGPAPCAPPLFFYVISSALVAETPEARSPHIAQRFGGRGA